MTLDKHRSITGAGTPSKCLEVVGRLKETRFRAGVRLANSAVAAVQDQLEAVVATGVPGRRWWPFGRRVELRAGAGFADVATGESHTVEHRFRIGSETKIFVRLPPHSSSSSARSAESVV